MVIGNLRCWVAGRTHRKGTQSQNVQIAHYFARQFYEQLLADLNRPGFELPESARVSRRLFGLSCCGHC